jgi:hypothetical protein
MPAETATYSSSGYWTSALAVALIDLPLVFVLVRVVGRDTWRQMKWPVAAAAALFWAIFATVLMWGYWDIYYQHFEAPWARYLAPAAGIFYALVGLLLWRLAQIPPLHPALTFCLLGGLESLVEHVPAIYAVGILEKVPGFAGVSVLSVLAFAVPEYVLYWGITLAIAVLLQRLWRGRERRQP